MLGLDVSEHAGNSIADELLWGYRMIKLGATYVLLASAAQLLVGCNANVFGKFGGTDKAYPGAERPASEISIFQCGFNLTVLAIDENRSLSGDSGACSYSLLPGRHTFRVSIAKSELNVGTWRQRGDQVVEYDLVAGKTYSLHAFQDKDSPGTWKINMSDPVVDKIVTLKVIHCRDGACA